MIHPLLIVSPNFDVRPVTAEVAGQAAQDLVPNHPTLGDVDSVEALEDYQAKKRAYRKTSRA